MANLTIRRILIKKRTFSEWLTCFIFVMPFLLSFLLEFLMLPSFVKYTADIAWIAVFVALFIRRQIVLDRRISPFTALIAISFLYVLIVYLFNFQSPFYLMWGVRNNFRFYIAFLAFCSMFDADAINSLFKLIDALFWINTAVSLFQFFALGYEQDYLGGIFGVERGCNAYSVIFFGLVTSKSILMFMSGRERALSCFLKCGITLIIAALAELKFFFVVFVMILGLATIFTKFSWRKFAVLFISAVLVMLAGTVLTAVFGASSNISIERIVELVTATNYATGEDLGRFTAIPTIAKTILTDLPSRLFGMGLGNCDTSAFAICNTPFYQTYSALHYTWFSSAFLFLETGYIGLILHLSFFITVFVLARRRLKSGEGDPLCCQIGMIFAALCVVLTFYNSSLRMEVGYIAYFALALPFIKNNDTETIMN